MIDFEYEVNKYGQSLSPRAKDKARAVFNELLGQGRSYEWLYYAIKNLRGRSILNCPRLLYYKEFQEEVDVLQQKGREIISGIYHRDAYRHWRANILSLPNANEEKFEKQYREKQRDFELSYYANFLGIGYLKVSDEEKEFCDNYFNASYEYKLEHETEILELYDKYWALPYLEEALKYD